MTLTQLRFSSLLVSALAIACTPSDPGNATDAGTSTKGTTSPTGDESGSVTSAAETSATATTNSPTMATATSAGTSSTDGPCSFLSCDDMTNPLDECDHRTQNCPEGQKCTVYIAGGGASWNARKCIDVTGTDKPGEPCTSEGAASGIDSCIKGAICLHLDEEGAGTCIAFCSGSPEAPYCEPPIVCTISRSAVLDLCIPSCNPVLQDCPNPLEACYPINDGFTCAQDASGDEGQANDPCEYINVCDKGLMCADAAFVGAGCEAGATGCCTPFCEFPDGPCPNPDQSCVQYFDPALFQENDPLLDIGTCGLPT